MQYIDMQDRFDGDIITMEFLMNAAAAIHRGFDFGWIMQDARVELEKELDFVNEGRNGEETRVEVAQVGNVTTPEVGDVVRGDCFISSFVIRDLNRSIGL